MRTKIHRGADQIGGSCVEVEHDGARLVLDVGKPLTAGWGEHVPLPPVPGLATGDPSILGVLISHGHQDHWGLIDQVHPDIPRFIGQGAADVLRAAAFWGSGIDLKESGHFTDREPFTLGPFTITPYLVDHSGFDAYALVIEAGGQRLMYSGDLRGHGRKSRLFEQLLTDRPAAINVLMLEGTHVGQESDVHGLQSETAVEDALTETASQTAGLVVVLNSTQNVDRVVTAYRAALRCGRDVAMDLYTAAAMAATGRDSIPQLGDDWPRVQVFVPKVQRVKVLKSGEFDRTYSVRAHRIFPETLLANPGKYMLVGAYQSELPRLISGGQLKDGVVVYSMWNGYLANKSGVQLRATLKSAEIPFVEHHTSGHANTADLRRLVDAIRPGSVVPIHTENPESYAELLGCPVTPHADGQWWSVIYPPESSK